MFTLVLRVKYRQEFFWNIYRTIKSFDPDFLLFTDLTKMIDYWCEIKTIKVTM